MEFLEDIAPFYRGKSITYVDVGAYVGHVANEVIGSSLFRVREAHLIEPNPKSFEALKERSKNMNVQRLEIENVALGSECGIAELRAAKSMTKAKMPKHSLEFCGSAEEADIQTIRCITLDQLAQDFTDKRASLVKIDAEGSEIEILAGAVKLLSEHRIDVIYIEAGLNPEGTQQCYYREIEDILSPFGYSIFRVYEQRHEWMTDSPLLRRVNIAFMSKTFADAHPYSLVDELDVLTTEVEEARNEVFRVGAVLAEERKQSESAQQRLADLESALNRCHAERMEREAVVEATLLERKIDGQRTLDHLDQSKAELRRASQKMLELFRYATRLERRIISIEESSSWRVTRPFRAIARLVRGLLGRRPVEPDLDRPTFLLRRD